MRQVHRELCSGMCCTIFIVEIYQLYRRKLVSMSSAVKMETVHES
jgi:hypothetical protein